MTTIFPMLIRIAKIQIALLQSKPPRKPSRYLTGLTICFRMRDKHTHTYEYMPKQLTIRYIYLGKFCHIKMVFCKTATKKI